MGNLHSVSRKLAKMGVEHKVSSSPKDIHAANKIILPGVGHFSQAMKNLREMNLIDALNKAVIGNQVPVLGICLGMQLMAKFSEEGNSGGLGWFDAEVVRFKVPDPYKTKIPHSGWNKVVLQKSSALFNDIPATSEYYFIHSFHFKCNNEEDVLNTTVYGYNFVSAVERENIFGVQYHPEKSHLAGQKLIYNFINIL
jgi:glutamine amidotransferase